MVTSADSTTYKYRDETFPPLTPFEVKVGVYNNKGDGPFSPVVIIHSAEGGEYLLYTFSWSWISSPHWEQFCNMLPYYWLSPCWTPQNPRKHRQMWRPRASPRHRLESPGNLPTLVPVDLEDMRFYYAAFFLFCFCMDSWALKYSVWHFASAHIFLQSHQISYLKVSYWKDVEQEESGRKQKTLKNETSIVLTQLEGNSLYAITVKGFNSIGQSPASSSVTARTKKDRKYWAFWNRCNR